MNSKNTLIAASIACAAIIGVSICGVAAAYHKYAAVMQSSSINAISLNSINSGMSYTVLDNKTNIYENPDKGSTVLMQVNAKDMVNFVSLSNNGFYKVSVNGVEGYIASDKLVDTTLATPAPTAAPQKTMYVVNVNNSISLRKTPDTNGETITTIPLGTAVEFIKKENDSFTKIKFEGKEGFAATKYLTENADLALQQAANRTSVSDNTPVQHATGSSDVSVKYLMYVVNVENSIYLRKYAEEGSGHYCTIPLGASVGFIEDVTNGFYKIKYNGQIGYAKAQYLSDSRPYTPSNGGGAVLHISGVEYSVYLRKTPSEPAEYICEIPVGSAVTYLGTIGDYDKVSYNGVIGYVTSKYVR